MQDWGSEFPFMRAGATIDRSQRLWLQLWLSYDFHHFLVLLVIVIDDLYDDNLYSPVPVARR